MFGSAGNKVNSPAAKVDDGGTLSGKLKYCAKVDPGGGSPRAASAALHTKRKFSERRPTHKENSASATPHTKRAFRECRPTHEGKFSEGPSTQRKSLHNLQTSAGAAVKSPPSATHRLIPRFRDTGGTSLTRKGPSLGPYTKSMPIAL